MGQTKSVVHDLPGSTVPLDPSHSQRGRVDLFPVALDDIKEGYIEYIFTLRELLMMQLMVAITDKPDWETKIHNKEITDKWRAEMAQSGQDVSPAMMDYMFEELKWKSTESQKTGFVRAYDPGVVRSDTAISEEIRHALQAAVKPLEDVPEEEKDYHPRSNNQVVDLVHPSLFPFVYGRTKVLRNTLIGIDDCFSSVGQGEIVKVANRGQSHNPESARRAVTHPNPSSEKFQWLPCNVQLNADGECKITSYINNLHPAKHRDLYGIVEHVLTRAVPLWSASLTQYCRPHRIPYRDVEYPSDEEPQPEELEGESDDEYDERYRAWKAQRNVKQPEPGSFEPPRVYWLGEVDLVKQFEESGLQVIVKLANIELTPEKPDYGGGSWHIEGQLNERICATALYYYDNENITPSTLAFRHRGDSEYIERMNYGQEEFEFMRVFGFDPDDGHQEVDCPITQNLGDITCKQGRLLTFPNTLQHRVSSFSLADKTKPGHRKILALFLIDPHRKIISTANVPPQREDWCNEWKEAVHDALGERLPFELQDMVQQNSELNPMTMGEAKALRLELMDERSKKEVEFNKDFEHGGFSLCEH
ncbi:hypothetical protein BDV18DRAFT_161375 [Aspergillus unguis]